MSGRSWEAGQLVITMPFVPGQAIGQDEVDVLQPSEILRLTGGVFSMEKSGALLRCGRKYAVAFVPLCHKFVLLRASFVDTGGQCACSCPSPQCFKS